MITNAAERFRFVAQDITGYGDSGSDMTFEGRDLVGRIGSLLYHRQYNRRYLPIQSGDVELSPTEFVVLAVYEFDRQLFMNGFDGFRINTDDEFTDFLPIALAEIGASLYSTLVRQAWEDRKDIDRRYDDLMFELIREEPFDELLIAYVELHRAKLPDPGLATPEFYAKLEEDRWRWREEKNAIRKSSP